MVGDGLGTLFFAITALYGLPYLLFGEDALGGRLHLQIARPP